MSTLRSLLFRLLGWLVTIIFSLCWAIPIAWATLAIYYSNLPWAGMRLALAAAFAVFTIWAIWFSRRRRMSVRSRSCCFSAWSLGGYPSVPRTIVTGGRKSR